MMMMMMINMVKMMMMINMVREATTAVALSQTILVYTGMTQH